MGGRLAHPVSFPPPRRNFLPRSMKPFSVTVFAGTGGDAITGEIGGNKILVEFDRRPRQVA